MRIIVFFDLPVTTAAKRKAANQFRQFLLKDGYQMLQLSVYSRIVKGRDSLQKHHNRLCANLPQEGSIRCLEVTEKQRPLQNSPKSPKFPPRHLGDFP